MLRALAYLSFDLKPDGRLESRYQLMGLIEGLVMPTVAREHFQLNDFTPFRDEIRKVDGDLMIGKWIADMPWPSEQPPPIASLGIFHTERDEATGKNRFGFYYLLTRAEDGKAPRTTLLGPLLEAELPRGLGMTFDEEMVGWFYPGQPTPEPGRKGDLTIAKRDTATGVECKFNVRMLVAELGEFIDGYEHEAGMSGTITFGKLGSLDRPVFPVDTVRSRFNYLRLNAETGEGEMRYRIEFADTSGVRYRFEGRKYMQKDEAIGVRGPQEVLDDYTTLYCHVYRLGPARGGRDRDGADEVPHVRGPGGGGESGGIPARVPRDRHQRPAAPVAGAGAIPGVHRAVRAGRVRSAGSAGDREWGGRVARNWVPVSSRFLLEPSLVLDP